MSNKLLWLSKMALWMGAVIAQQSGCPTPTPDPTPTPRPPVLTSCGLIGRNCNVTMGTSPIEVAFEDFDADNHLDMAVALYGSDGVAVLLNDGAGTFALEDTLAVGDSPYSVTVGDFDGDGNPDLAAVALANIVGPAVTVFSNQGNASFIPAGTLDLGAVANFVTNGDLDGDNNLDLVTVHELDNSLSTLMNNGDGTFAGATEITTGIGPKSVVIADLGGDSGQDLAVANAGSDDISILINAGGGTFNSPVNFAVGNNPSSLAAGDFDGDGDLDLAVANEGEFEDADLDKVSILLKDGTGAFVTVANIPVGVNPRDIAVGDLDSDNDLDLVVANSGYTQDTSTIAVLLNNGDGTFAAAVRWSTGWAPNSVALGDLDGDGVTNDVTLLANDGNGGFAPTD
ncbi:MAG: FG-GAP repeat domain-containing protein [Planctomycetota bacterium]